MNVNPLLRALPSDKLPHVWQVCSTLLAVASMFTLCWWLSKNGLLDLAATGISFFAVTFLRMVGPSLAKRAPREFERTAGLLDTARADFAQWMSHRKLLRGRADRAFGSRAPGKASIPPVALPRLADQAADDDDRAGQRDPGVLHTPLPVGHLCQRREPSVVP